MRKIQLKIDGLRNFQDSLYDLIQAVIADNEEIIVEMNSEDQLYEHGVNRLGVPLEDYAPYRPFTIEVKRALGQPTDRVTLRDTGAFHRSFYIKFVDTGFIISAHDEKRDDLVAKYGRQIFGLDESNMKDLAESYVKPYLLEMLRRI